MFTYVLGMFMNHATFIVEAHCIYNGAHNIFFLLDVVAQIVFDAYIPVHNVALSIIHIIAKIYNQR